MIPDTVPLLRNRELINEVPFQFASKPFDSAETVDEPRRPREDVETAETRPFVPKRTPFSEEARFVLPLTDRFVVEALANVV